MRMSPRSYACGASRRSASAGASARRPRPQPRETRAAAGGRRALGGLDEDGGRAGGGAAREVGEEREQRLGAVYVEAGARLAGADLDRDGGGRERREERLVRLVVAGGEDEARPVARPPGQGRGALVRAGGLHLDDLLAL